MRWFLAETDSLPSRFLIGQMDVGGNMVKSVKKSQQKEFICIIFGVC